MSTSWTDTCLCNCSFSVVARSRASLQVLKSTSTPVNCVSTFVLFVRKRFTSCTSSSALWITISGLWCVVSQYSTFNPCANLRTKSYQKYKISKKRFEYKEKEKIDMIFLREINGGVDSVSREARSRMLKYTAPADSDVLVLSIESPPIYCVPIVEFSYRILWPFPRGTLRHVADPVSWSHFCPGTHRDFSPSLPIPEIVIGFYKMYIIFHPPTTDSIALIFSMKDSRAKWKKWIISALINGWTL